MKKTLDIDCDELINIFDDSMKLEKTRSESKTACVELLGTSGIGSKKWEEEHRQIRTSIFAKEPSLKAESIFVSGKDLGDTGNSSGKKKLGASSMAMSLGETSLFSGLSSFLLDCDDLIEEDGQSK